jgi:hypothetical protein
MEKRKRGRPPKKKENFEPEVVLPKRPRGRPATGRQKRDQTRVAMRGKALDNLQALWRIDHEGETWCPDGEPVITPMLEAVEGGIEHCIRALRSYEEEDAKRFLFFWDQFTENWRKHLKIEEIAYASGIGSLRLAEVIQTALYLYGNMQTQMMLAAGLPAIVAQSLKQAKRSKGFVDREWMLKAGKILPIPKGAQTAIQINAGQMAEVTEVEASRQEWKYPEDRLKEIVSVLNPKQLQSNHASGEMIHLNPNRPTVFER